MTRGVLFTFAYIFTVVLADYETNEATVLEGSRAVSKYEIATKPCRNKKGEKGLCMFNVECQIRNGIVLGTCMDRFLFGACCTLPEKGVESSTKMLAAGASQDDSVEIPVIPVAMNATPSLVFNDDFTRDASSAISTSTEGWWFYPKFPSSKKRRPTEKDAASQNHQLENEGSPSEKTLISSTRRPVISAVQNSTGYYDYTVYQKIPVSMSSQLSTAYTFVPLEQPVSSSSVFSTLSRSITTMTSTVISSSIPTSMFSTKPSTPKHEWDYRKDCGVRPIHPEARVVGGRKSKFGEWPWQVLVRESTWLGLFTKNKCGGVLISKRHVLTAAHCQPSSFLASLVVVLGEQDISGSYEPMKPQVRQVRTVYVHKEFVPATFENDLAVLELQLPVDLRPHIVPICMPDDSSRFEGRMAKVSGWGRLSYNGGVPSLLQVVEVPMITNDECQEMFIQSGHSKKILDSFLCAGYLNGKKDSCEGDSGGPLMVKSNDGRWILAGTVSHGIRCAAPNLPGVYMRMQFYKPWIRGIVRQFAGEAHFE